MRGGLLHLGSELRRRGAGRLLHLFANLLADALGRLGCGAFGFATNAIGLRHQAPLGVCRRIGDAGLEPTLPLSANRVDFLPVSVGGVSGGLRKALDLDATAFRFAGQPSFGLGGGIGQAGLQPSVPFLADSLEFLAVSIGGLGGRLREFLDLDAAAFGFAGQPSFGFGGGISQAGLKPSIPFLADGVEPRRPLRFVLAAGAFALLLVPSGHLGDLGLEIGLQSSA